MFHLNDFSSLGLSRRYDGAFIDKIDTSLFDAATYGDQNALEFAHEPRSLPVRLSKKQMNIVGCFKTTQNNSHGSTTHTSEFQYIIIFYGLYY